MKRISMAAILLVCAGLAQASATDKKAAADGKAPSKLVCFMEATTGSHLKKRVCMTEEERARKKEASQTAAERLNRSAPASANRDKASGR